MPLQTTDLSAPTHLLAHSHLPANRPQTEGPQLQRVAGLGAAEPPPWSGQVRLLYHRLLLWSFMTSAFWLYLIEGDVEPPVGTATVRKDGKLSHVLTDCQLFWYHSRERTCRYPRPCPALGPRPRVLSCNVWRT